MRLRLSTKGTMKSTIHNNVEEMFAAIPRDENGFVKPKQYIPKPGQEFIRLSDGARESLEELLGNPEMNTARYSDNLDR